MLRFYVTPHVGKVGNERETASLAENNNAKSMEGQRIVTERREQTIMMQTLETIQNT